MLMFDKTVNSKVSECIIFAHWQCIAGSDFVTQLIVVDNWERKCFGENFVNEALIWWYKSKLKLYSNECFRDAGCSYGVQDICRCLASSGLASSIQFMFIRGSYCLDTIAGGKCSEIFNVTPALKEKPFLGKYLLQMLSVLTGVYSLAVVCTESGPVAGDPCSLCKCFTPGNCVVSRPDVFSSRSVGLLIRFWRQKLVNILENDLLWMRHM